MMTQGQIDVSALSIDESIKLAAELQRHISKLDSQRTELKFTVTLGVSNYHSRTDDFSDIQTTADFLVDLITGGLKGDWNRNSSVGLVSVVTLD